MIVLVPLSVHSQVTVRTGDVQQGGTTDRCCFNNFRFAGTCEVRIGQNERCADVLGVLNNFQSVGNTYCGGTTVRGGWTMVDCAPGSASFELDTRTDSLTPESKVQAPRATGTESIQVHGSGSTRGTSGSNNFVTPTQKESVTVESAGLISL
jgi:hypothetical protein